jgi:phospholipase/carboxylesterase
MGLNPSRMNPHQAQPVLMTGETLEDAQAVMLMLHGRGATAQDILSLSIEFDQSSFAYLAPQAAGGTWYPNRFMAPIGQNEPWLSWALDTVGVVYSRILEAGITPERVVLLGFSQGACLALEYAARNTRRYGGIVGLSGALIGPEEMQRSYSGSLAGTPVFLGCSDVDFHIPRERVDHAAEVMRVLGGNVTERLYPNMDHTINQDEVDFVRRMMQVLLAGQ